MSLGSVAAKGAVVTIGLQGARFAIQFAGLVVLGRLLAPADFGLVAMVTAIIGIGDILREFGLVPAAVQAATLSKKQRANLFWLCSLLGLIVAGLAALASPLIAALYSDDRLIDITLALSLTFIFNGVQAQFQAALARELRFASLSVTDLCAQFVGLGLAVLAAMSGAGYWSIIIQLVVQSAVLLFLRALVCKWLPGWPSRSTSIMTQVNYGRSLVLTQSLVYVSSNIDSFLVGAKFGPTQLGFYNRGFQILMMPLNQILTPLTTVALPVLSRLRDEPARFNSYLQRAQIVLAYPAVMLFSVMASAAHPLIKIVFGEQWLPSADIFQILAVAGAFQAIGYIGYWIFLSKGLTGSHFRFSLLSRSVLIASILVGSNWGPWGIAAGYSLGTMLNWPLVLVWLRRGASIDVWPLAFGGIRAAVLGAACAAISSGMNYLAGPQADLISILIVVASSLVIAGLVGILVPAYRRDVVAMIDTAKLVVAPKTPMLENVGKGTS